MLLSVFNLNQKQIALSCSSHCGEYFHIRELKKWINKTKLKLSNLKCGVHNPLDSKSTEKLFLSGNNLTNFIIIVLENT